MTLSTLIFNIKCIKYIYDSRLGYKICTNILHTLALGILILKLTRFWQTDCTIHSNVQNYLVVV